MNFLIYIPVLFVGFLIGCIFAVAIYARLGIVVFSEILRSSRNRNK